MYEFNEICQQVFWSLKGGNQLNDGRKRKSSVVLLILLEVKPFTKSIVISLKENFQINNAKFVVHSTLHVYFYLRAISLHFFHQLVKLH